MAQCVAMKFGYLADDGTINKTAMEAVYSERFKERAKLVENMVKNCIYGDLNVYGPEDDCDMLKIQNCLNVQYAMVNIILKYNCISIFITKFCLSTTSFI